MKWRCLLAFLAATAALFVPAAAAHHGWYCGHSIKNYNNNGNQDRAVYHHKENLQGQHWHFYLHDRWIYGVGWMRLHGYWHRCD